MKTQRETSKFGAIGKSLLLLLVGAALFWLGSKFAYRDKAGQASSSDTASLQTILDKGEIRCSYLLYSPYFRKDPNTGKMSGIFYDVMEEIGKRSSLKINWAEEVGYEAIFTGLNSNRVDVFAGGLWPNSSRARTGLFTEPVFYSVITAWGRSDENRFADNFKGLDSPEIRIATIDGAMEDIISKTNFPNAKRVSLPQSSPFTQSLLNITTSKADITFAEPSVIGEFLKANPGKLKQLANGKPLRIFGNTLVVSPRNLALKEFLDVALMEILYDGTIDEILSRYESTPEEFPRVALPYR